jgi:vacuolar-type H+-ATPase subunit H
MTQDEIMKMAREAGLHIATDVNWMPIIGIAYAEKFAELVAEAERREMQAKIETLHAMYEQAVKQRDYLMDQQRAQIEAMRGRVQ